MSKSIIEKLGITPGPWYIGGEGGAGGRIDMVYRDDELGSRVSDCSTAGMGVSGSEMVKNARLIAAAPEMVMALIDITSEQETYYRNMFIESGWEKLFRKKHGAQVSIIEKATGRTWAEIKELLNE